MEESDSDQVEGCACDCPPQWQGQQCQRQSSAFRYQFQFCMLKKLCFFVDNKALLRNSVMVTLTVPLENVSGLPISFIRDLMHCGTHGYAVP